MEKEKKLINRSCKIIFMSLIIIAFIEMENWAPVRVFIVNKCNFFKGKGNLLSNIFIGILGSAILTCICELTEYNALKDKIENDILRLYEKWDKDVKYKIGYFFEDIQEIELFRDDVYEYWEEIHSIYVLYRPFSRGGIYIQLIKTLYEYVNELKKYFVDKENFQKEKKYISKRICIMKQLKGKNINNKKFCEDADALIKLYTESLENLYITKREIEGKGTLSNINRRRAHVLEMSSHVDVLKLSKSRKSVQRQDSAIDLQNLKLEQKIMKLKWLCYKIKKFFRNIIFRITCGIANHRHKIREHKKNKK